MIGDEIIESRISRMFFAVLSSTIALYITHPLDVLKLNLQVKPLKVKELVTFYYVSDRRRIYRGIMGAGARSMVFSNLQFELYELAGRRNLLNSFQEKIQIAALSGSIAGVIITPITKIHIRNANDNLLPPNERRYYKGLYNGLCRVYREEGLRMMFAGTIVSSLRGMMGTIGKLAFYDEVICDEGFRRKDLTREIQKYSSDIDRNSSAL